MSTAAGQAVYRHIEYLAINDESELLLRALAEAVGALFEQARSAVLGDETTRPGQKLWDPAVAELWALQWTRQLSGAQIPPRIAGETDDAYLQRARDEVIHVRGWRRTSPDAILTLAAARLTGSRLVTLYENVDGNPWRAIVITYEAETPTPELTAADLTDPKVVPAGVNLIARTDPGWSIEQMEAAYAGRTIADLEADFPTIDALERNLPG